MRSLIAADCSMASERLRDHLRTVGLVSDLVNDGADCVLMLGLHPYDILIIDLDLPGAFDVLRDLRHGGETIPVMGLAPAQDVAARVKALELGADDCMERPLDHAEWLARIRAVVRRAKGFAHSLVEVGPLQIDLSARTVRCDGRAIGLTGREYELLEILSLRRGCVVSRRTIMNHLYGAMDWPNEKIVDVYISRLRRKLLQAGGARDCIRTNCRRGFRMEASETGAPRQAHPMRASLAA